MRRMFLATALAAMLVGPEPALAVLSSASLTITDQGRPIPGATIVLTRPRPRTARPAAAAPQQPAASQQVQQQPYQPSYQPYQPSYQPPPERPQGQTWVNARSDATGRILLQYDDREALPGTVVDITAYYPNGETRRLIDVPIESVLSGQAIDLAGAAGAQPYYASPSPAYSYPPPDASGPPPGVGGMGGIPPGILPGIGVSIGGGRGDYERRRER